MSSLPHAQPEPSGSLSQENAPWVVVRAGKHYVCSACGVMVEIPEDVVGQLVLVSPEASREENHCEIPAEAVPVQSESTEKRNDSRGQHSQSVAAEIPSLRTKSNKTRPPRPKRPKHPRPALFAGQMIDGLKVPSARELDRALAWVSFHLTVLDKQDSELHRLKKLLKQQGTESVSRATKKVSPHQFDGPSERSKQEHAQADFGVAPESHCNSQHSIDKSKSSKEATERGPP